LKELKEKAAKGIFWTFIDKAGSQFIGFVITIFLARFLSPDQFGLIAMASIIIAITRVLIDSGLNDSLIQKKACTQVDYSTVFIFNMIMSFFFFLIIFFSAPFVALFFGYQELTPIVRMLGLKPIFASFSFVQVSILQKQLKFSLIAKIRIPAFLVSGCVGLLLAWLNWGVWALVWQSILETFLFTCLMWIFAEWRPRLLFDREIFKFHWKHGSRLFAVSLLGAIYRNVFSLIVGKYYSAAQLGFFSRAESFRTIILNNTTGLVQTVSYPILSQFQDDNEKLKSTYRKIMQVTVFGLLPIVSFMIVAAKPIVLFLFTDKWLPVVPILVALMMSLVFSPFNSINLNILKVKRRTDLLLRTNFLNKILLVAIVLIAVNLGFDYLIWTNLIIALLALGINNYYTNRLIQYSVLEQIKDLWPLLLACLIAVGATVLITSLLYQGILMLDILLGGFLSLTAYLFVVYIIDRKFIGTIIGDLRLLIKRS
jgi:teichuronic acid exporter